MAHITLNETKTCCDSEEDMPSDCCHDEFEQLVLDDSQLDHQTLQLQPLTFITVRLLTQFLRFYPEVVYSFSAGDRLSLPALTGYCPVSAGAILLNLAEPSKLFAV